MKKLKDLTTDEMNYVFCINRGICRFYTDKFIRMAYSDVECYVKIADFLDYEYGTNCYSYVKMDKFTMHDIKISWGKIVRAETETGLGFIDSESLERLETLLDKYENADDDDRESLFDDAHELAIEIEHTISNNITRYFDNCENKSDALVYFLEFGKEDFEDVEIDKDYKAYRTTVVCLAE